VAKPYLLVLWGTLANGRLRTLVLARGTRRYCEVTREFVERRGLGGPVFDEMLDPKWTLVEAGKWDGFLARFEAEQLHPFEADVVEVQ